MMIGRSLSQMFLVHIGFQPYLTSLAFRSARLETSLQTVLLNVREYAMFNLREWTDTTITAGFETTDLLLR